MNPVTVVDMLAGEVQRQNVGGSGNGPGATAKPPFSTAHRCPRCGSFLDAPRIAPASGARSRKCASCVKWYPIEATWEVASIPSRWGIDAG